jgi:hypothetical protein
LTGVLGLAGNIVASFVTDWSGSLSSFAVPVAAVATAVAGACVTSHVEDRVQDSGGHPPVLPDWTFLPAAIIAVVRVIGPGGFAATFGIRYAVGYISGDEPGTDRLVQSVATEPKG